MERLPTMPRFFWFLTLAVAVAQPTYGNVHEKSPVRDTVSLKQDPSSAIVGGLVGAVTSIQPRGTTSARSGEVVRGTEQRREDAARLQRALALLGFNPGVPDGIIGPATRGALEQYRLSLEQDGIRVSSEQLSSSLVSAFSAGETTEDMSAEALTRRHIWALAGQVAQLNAPNPVVLPPAPTIIVSNGGDQSTTTRTVPPPSATGTSGPVLPTFNFSAPPAAPATADSAAGSTRAVGTSSSGPVPVSTGRNLFASAPPNRPISSRRFSGPAQYPPQDFLGYAVVVSPSMPTEFDRLRFQIICEAYAASMLPVTSVSEPESDQFVTVWPVLSAGIADELNQFGQNAISRVCDTAVGSYDQVSALSSLRAAERAGFQLDDRGPFVFGWLPSAGVGDEDSLILTMDLSRVESYAQAHALFIGWRRDVETSPELLRQGFAPEIIRRRIQRWADSFGPGILSMW